jgi:hypothetical protein
MQSLAANLTLVGADAAHQNYSMSELPTEPNATTTRLGETKVDKQPTARFSMGRVLVALAGVAICGLIVWIAPDMLAEMQARNAYDHVASLIKDKQVGETSYAQVHDALGREPTNTSDLLHGRYEENYVFEGTNKRFTIKLEYWQFDDDEQWYLFSSQLKSERMLR